VGFVANKSKLVAGRRKSPL